MDEIEDHALRLLQFIRNIAENSEVSSFGISLPTMAHNHLKTLAQRVFIGNVCHALLMSDSSATHRSVFYRSLTIDTGLFSNQVSVNSQVHALGDVLGMDTRDLGFLSTSKGLVATSDPATSVSFADVSISLADHVDGVVISDIIARGSLFETAVGAVVITEKDTVFQHIVSRWSPTLSSRVLLVTAKGFPDRSTVDFLRSIYTNRNLSFFYLGDLDPYGISIYLNYVKKIVADATRRIEWIGVRVADIDKVETMVPAVPLGIPMKERDTAILEGLKDSELVAESDLGAEIKLLQDRRMKYEVECLHAIGEDYILGWLQEKLFL